MFTGIGAIAFFCICAATAAGFLIGRWLPENDRSEGTQKIVQTVMSVVGLLSALVLSLLIASTKANFDTRSGEVEQFASNITLLDRELAHFDPDIKDARALLRTFTIRKMALTWPTDREVRPVMHDPQTVQLLDDIQTRLRAWSPQAEPQREGRVSALQYIHELKRTSQLLAIQQSVRTPPPFLIAVIFWLSMLFLSHAIFAPLNRTVVAAIIVSALSVSIAVNLIFDMDQPFSGFVRVSPASMQQALDELTP